MLKAARRAASKTAAAKVRVANRFALEVRAGRLCRFDVRKVYDFPSPPPLLRRLCRPLARNKILSVRGTASWRRSRKPISALRRVFDSPHIRSGKAAIFITQTKPNCKLL